MKLTQQPNYSLTQEKSKQLLTNPVYSQQRLHMLVISNLIRKNKSKDSYILTQKGKIMGNILFFFSYFLQIDKTYKQVSLELNHDK